MTIKECQHSLSYEYEYIYFQLDQSKLFQQEQSYQYEPGTQLIQSKQSLKMPYEIRPKQS